MATSASEKNRKVKQLTTNSTLGNRTGSSNRETVRKTKKLESDEDAIRNAFYKNKK